MTPYFWVGRTLRRADGGEELGHLAAQLLGALAERLGGRLDVLRRGARRIGAARHPAETRRGVLGAARRALRVAGDLLGGGALFLDRPRDRGRDLADLADGAADPLDGVHRVLGDLLHGGDLAGDLLGRLGGLVG